MELGEIEAASLRLVPQLLNVAVELVEGLLVRSSLEPMEH